MQKRILQLSFVLLIASVSHNSFGQGNDSTSTHTFKVDGTLKNKFEYASDTHMSRFSVRNSRVGVSGDIDNTYAYRVQVELSDEGEFKVLDLSGTLKPVEGLSFTLGQTSIPLFNSYIVSPSEMMFANRTFLGKYFLSTRDLGILTKYDFSLGVVPTRLEFGLYNGNAINNPVWKKEMSYGGRITLGSMKGARMSTKVYNYPNDESTHHLFYGIDARYEGDNWKVETEIMKRESQTEQHSDLLAYYVQGAYVLPVNTRFFDYVQPAARWDAIDDTQGEDGFDVKRITAGLGFGFNQERFSSILRIDYEWYFLNNTLPIFVNDEMDSDKITVELLFTF